MQRRVRVLSVIVAGLGITSGVLFSSISYRDHNAKVQITQSACSATSYRTNIDCAKPYPEIKLGTVIVTPTPKELRLAEAQDLYQHNSAAGAPEPVTQRFAGDAQKRSG